MILHIVRDTNPVLRQVSAEVKKVDKSHAKLAEDMLETLREHNGVGLAAPQVGVPLRLIVVEYGPETYTVINPRIVWASQTYEEDTEGCLSIPHVQGLVSRPDEVRVIGKTLKGTRFEHSAYGLMARIFCHEIDHLDGILYIDKLVPGTYLQYEQGKDMAYAV